MSLLPFLRTRPQPQPSAMHRLMAEVISKTGHQDRDITRELVARLVLNEKLAPHEGRELLARLNQSLT